MANELAQVNPTILTKADPSGEDLLQVRADVQSHGQLKQLFLDGLPKEELVTRLTTELRKLWDGGDPSEAVRFLVDEYAQLGPKGVQVVSTETGRVIAIIREEDIYQPPDVPREGGRMAKPLPTLRPEIASAITMWVSDTGREKATLKALSERGYQTQLLRDMGDPRLLVATKKGRQDIVRSLGTKDPRALLEAAGGTAGAFLQRFIFGKPPEGSELVHVHGTLMSKSVMGVQDPRTTNLHHNRPATLRGVLVQGWVREIARMIYREMAHKPRAGTIDTLHDVLLPHQLWVAPPDLVRPFKALQSSAIVLPIEDPTSAAMAIVGQLGYIRVPAAFEAFSSEMFDRWEASAVLDFDVWIDPSQILMYDVEGVSLQAQVLL